MRLLAAAEDAQPAAVLYPALAALQQPGEGSSCCCGRHPYFPDQYALRSPCASVDCKFVAVLAGTIGLTYLT